MCENELSALRALNDAGERELPVVGSSLISACFGYLSLRYCHSYTSLDSAITRNLSILFINFIYGSFSDLTDKSFSDLTDKSFFFFLGEEIFKYGEAGVYLLGGAGAISLALGLAAFRTKSLAVLRAK